MTHNLYESFPVFRMQKCEFCRRLHHRLGRQEDKRTEDQSPLWRNVSRRYFFYIFFLVQLFFFTIFVFFQQTKDYPCDLESIVTAVVFFYTASEAALPLVHKNHTRNLFSLKVPIFEHRSRKEHLMESASKTYVIWLGCLTHSVTTFLQ